MALAEHLHRAKRAADALEELGPLGTENRDSQSLRASILRDLGRQEEEVAVLQELAEADPGMPNYRIRLGHAYRTLGRTDDAIAAYRSVIAQSPHEGTSWWSLANLKTMKFSDAEIAQMESGLTNPQSPLTNRIRLSFALGKAFEDRGEPDEAFRHYAEGNRLRMTIATYRPEKLTHWVEDAAATSSDAFFRDRAGWGFPAPDPVFVVGLQRSGSTLVEQILDSHPQIEGTAELTELPTIIREQSDIAHRRNLTFDEHLRRMSADDLRALGEEYLRRARHFRLTDKPFFTDKMPVNWLYVGIIRLILPNAKIIDARRHPLACCFANWKQLYGKGLEHTY